MREGKPTSSPSGADEREQQCLEQDRTGDLAPRSADRAQHADLTQALRHGHVERVQDQDTTKAAIAAKKSRIESNAFSWLSTLLLF